MSFMRCRFCGKTAGNMMKSTDWICGDCVKMLGGMKHWMEIRELSTEEVFIALGADKEAQRESEVMSSRFSDESLKRAKVRVNRNYSTISRRRGGCLATIGWTFLILVIIVALIGLLANLFYYIPKNNGEMSLAEQNQVTTFSKGDVELLNSLGLTEVHIIQSIKRNDKYDVMTARIFDSENMQLNVTRENGNIIYVQLTGIVSTKDQNDRKDALTMSSRWNGKAEVDMYSDTEGGKMAELDWPRKRLTIFKNSK